jgi:hypothetical protein
VLGWAWVGGSVVAGAAAPSRVLKLLAWRHLGFSTDLVGAISPQDKQRLEAACATGREPVEIARLRGAKAEASHYHGGR